MSFVYDAINVFCFPTTAVRDNYSKNDIIKCFIYLNLTDKDSCLLFFIFLCKLVCSITEEKDGNLAFEI